MNKTPHPLDKDYIAWLDSYAESVENTFTDQFRAAGSRMIGAAKLLRRFTEAMTAVVSNGRSHFHAVDEAHNELCAASALLSAKKTIFTTITYEPPLPGIDQSIDFVAAADSGVTLYVDVKTIKPALNNRWDQFEKIKREGKIPATSMSSSQKTGSAGNSGTACSPRVHVCSNMRSSSKQRSGAQTLRPTTSGSS